MEGEARFVGIDVSKAQLDVAVRPTGKCRFHRGFSLGRVRHHAVRPDGEPHTFRTGDGWFAYNLAQPWS